MRGRPIALALLVLLAACHRDAPAGPSASASTSADAASANVDAASATIADATAPPDLVTHASTAPGDGGVVVAADRVVDGNALRARNKPRLAAVTPIAIVKGGTPRDLGERLCKQIVPNRPPETPILLKPNLGGFDWFKDPAKSGGDDGLRGRITDPEFVRGVVRCLRARGHQKITIAEGWGARHADWEKLVDASGYRKMAAEENVPLVAMDDDGVFDVEGDAPGKPLRITGMEATKVPTLLVPKILADHLEHGLFISLPKIKAHRFGVFSMSIKGMQGTVMLSDASPAYRQKSRMHRELNAWLGTKDGDRATYVASLETFAERIADVLEVEAPDVVLAEGAPAMGGDGFQKMWPSGESFAIGGTNPILVDRAGAQMLDLWKNEALGRELGGHETSPLLEVAAKRAGIDLVPVPRAIGDGADLLARPHPTHFVGMAGFAIHSTATVHAAHGEPSAVDGKGDDPIWQKATPVAWDTDWSGAKTGIVTHARFAWSEHALHALFDVEGTDLFVDTTRPTDVDRPKLYEEDCVEMFVGADAADARHYYEIEVGPFGHFLDLEVGGSPSRGVGWSSELEVKTTRDPTARRATIEMSVRAPEIVRLVKANAVLRLALYRMEGKAPRRYLALSPTRTEKPNFHVPEAFGVLVLSP